MFIPKIGEQMTVTLPNEAVRATVANVINKDMIEADLNLMQPFTRIHGYGFGQRLKFRRASDVFGEKWALVENQPKATPNKAIVKAQFAPGDDRPVPDEKPRIVPKVRRRSDIEADKPKKAKK